MIISNNTSADIKTKSAGVLLKMIIILSATVFLKWTDFNNSVVKSDQLKLFGKSMDGPFVEFQFVDKGKWQT